MWIPLFGWQLNPMFGAAAMSLSSFCVVTNALRLNWFRLHRTDRDKKLKFHMQPIFTQEDSTMKLTLNIKGMMCGHCEATVKKCLEAFPEVEQAEVSHEAGTAVVSLNQEIDSAKLKEAVEKQGYKVTGEILG